MNEKTARTKLDILYQDVLGEINETINRVELIKTILPAQAADVEKRLTAMIANLAAAGDQYSKHINNYTAAASEELAAEIQKQAAVALEQILRECQITIKTMMQDEVLALVHQSLGGVVQAANKAEKDLKSATANFTRNWLMLAGASVAGAFLVLLLSVRITVWWERSELERLQEEKSVMEREVKRLDQLRAGIKIESCGEKRLPCVEVDTREAYGAGDHRYYILR